jgi:hypothetical protein
MRAFKVSMKVSVAFPLSYLALNTEYFDNAESAMNILRMVKLFAWENKVKEQLEEKREEELRWLKKKYWLQLVNMDVK